MIRVQSLAVSVFDRIAACFSPRSKPDHLLRGELGERAALRYLQAQGMELLARNFRSRRGEIDLIFRIADPSTGAGTVPNPLKKLIRKFAASGTDCLAFVEVKTRASGQWERPAAAVDARKRRLLSQTALDYLALIKNPPVKIRFDIVEVLVNGEAVAEIRHLPNTFVMARPYRYG